MLAILNFLNAHNLPICQPILMILVSKFMVHRALSDKSYLSLGLLSPLTPSLRDNLSGKPIFGLPVRPLKTGLQRHSKHKTEQKHKRSTKEEPPWNGQ